MRIDIDVDEIDKITDIEVKNPIEVSQIFVERNNLVVFELTLLFNYLHL